MRLYFVEQPALIAIDYQEITLSQRWKIFS